METLRAIPILVLLVSCGGGGGGGASLPQGQILDSAIDGVEYNAVSASGITDPIGRFFYSPGEEVRFAVGGVEIGAVQASSVVLIEDLVETEDEAVNIARFLQTIDEDYYPANGIQISNAVRDAASGLVLDFAQDPSVWAEIPSVVSVFDAVAPGVPIVTAEDAAAHLDAWKMASFAGEYSGVFDGSEISGAVGWRMVVDNFGTFALSIYWGDPDRPEVDTVLGEIDDGSVFATMSSAWFGDEVSFELSIDGGIVAGLVAAGPYSEFVSGSKDVPGLVAWEPPDEDVAYEGLIYDFEDGTGIEGVFRICFGYEEVFGRRSLYFELDYYEDYPDPLAGVFTEVGVGYVSFVSAGVLRFGGLSDDGSTLRGEVVGSEVVGEGFGWLEVEDTFSGSEVAGPGCF